ncbi:hypothetical protein V8C43DRAFT_292367 [Trichoderma afarasin]
MEVWRSVPGSNGHYRCEATTICTNWHHNAMGLSQAREHVIMGGLVGPFAGPRTRLHVHLHTRISTLHFAGETLSGSGSCISCV